MPELQWHSSLSEENETQNRNLVQVDTQAAGRNETQDEQAEEEAEGENETDSQQIEGGENGQRLTPSRQRLPSQQGTPVKQEIKQQDASPVERASSPQTRIFTRTNRGVPPERLQVGVSYAETDQIAPQTFQDVQNLPQQEKAKWHKAMQEELDSMKQLKVYTLCDLPAGEKALGCRWVYRIKQDMQGTIYKARLVAQGYAQEQYEDVFSPTIAAPSIRLLLTVAAAKGWAVRHFDVKTAYLNAVVHDQVYLKQPPGFEKGNQVWKIERAIYGLKRSAKDWNQHFDSVVKELGFKPSKADPCVYTKGSGNNQIVLAIFVDDLLILNQDKKMIQKTAQQLEKAFKMRYLGEVSNYLGIEIHRDEKGFKICQTQKIEQLLVKWKMADSKIVHTPMEADSRTVAAEAEEQQPCDENQYKSLLGSLLHVALWTRPDIANAVNRLSRKAAKPTQKDWKGLKRILRYLKGTKDYKLKLQPEGPLWLECFADSDWAQSEDRKSTSGMAIVLGGALIDWRTKRQTCLALSTCEAEYASLSMVATELIWYQQILKDLDIEQVDPVIVREDNMACIQLAQSERTRGRSKHMDLRYENVKEAVHTGRMQLVFCPSEENVADILTKPLARCKHQRGLTMLGLE